MKHTRFVMATYNIQQIIKNALISLFSDILSRTFVIIAENGKNMQNASPNLLFGHFKTRKSKE